jgi:hypothetical protein
MTCSKENADYDERAKTGKASGILPHPTKRSRKFSLDIVFEKKKKLLEGWRIGSRMTSVKDNVRIRRCTFNFVT